MKKVKYLIVIFALIGISCSDESVPVETEPEITPEIVKLTVSGSVSDGTDLLSGVDIFIGDTLAASSDADGKYIIELEGEGTRKIAFEIDGYQRLDTTVIVFSDLVFDVELVKIINYFPLSDGDVQFYNFQQVETYANEETRDSCDIVWNIELVETTDQRNEYLITEVITGIRTELIYNDGSFVWEIYSETDIDTTLSFTVYEYADRIVFDQPYVLVGPLFLYLEFSNYNPRSQSGVINLTGYIEEYFQYDLSLSEEKGIAEYNMIFQPGHTKRVYNLTRISD
ncbi:MAG: hypothetical protein SCALA702_04420 [Melioribacteraceae bacterium]|nr:MAG: hypothetical protein SCALA702_04420 [Melioribacteraceae bacterium]